jgi:uncharacterized protein (TIGR01777 family)
MNIIVSGGRGFIGSHLVPALIAGGHSVTVWSRTPQEEKRPGVGAYYWSAAEAPPPLESLEGIDAVVHLAGESVAHKWTDEVKKKIHESRVLGTRHLNEALAKLSVKPKVLVCAAATGYYGDRADEELTEESAPGTGFLAGVCQDWEHEADGASALGLRVVKLRTGMVLAHGGGALARLTHAFRTKMGGKLGSGKQWMPWVHMADLVALYQLALDSEIAGVFNATSPNPVRNEDFTHALGDAMGEPTKVTVPEFALKMLFGEMSEVLLASQRVLPKATEAAGFTFRYPEIADTLRDTVKAES